MNETKIEVFKSRSYVSCLSSAFNLFKNNYLKILAFLWPIILVYSIVFSFYLMSVFNYSEVDLLRFGKHLIIKNIILLVLLLFSSVVFVGFLYSYLQQFLDLGFFIKRKPFSDFKISLKYICRTLLLSAFGLLISFLLTILLVISASFYHILIFVIIPLLALIYLILFIVPPFEYLFGKTSFLGSFYTSFILSIKNLGGLLIILFVYIFFSFLIHLLASLPFNILSMVNILAQKSFILGDSVTLPVGFDFLRFILGMITAFFDIINNIFFVFCILFFWGAQKAKAKIKLEYKSRNQENLQ